MESDSSSIPFAPRLNSTRPRPNERITFGSRLPNKMSTTNAIKISSQGPENIAKPCSKECVIVTDAEWGLANKRRKLDGAPACHAQETGRLDGGQCQNQLVRNRSRLPGDGKRDTMIVLIRVEVSNPPMYSTSGKPRLDSGLLHTGRHGLGPKCTAQAS